MSFNDAQSSISTLTTTEEQTLVRASVGGDVEAFEVLYQNYAPTIYRYIAYRVNPASEAEDLTAQVFLSAWRAIERYQQQTTPFIAWLYTIAHNQVINFGKSKSQTMNMAPIDEAYDLTDTNRHNSPDFQLDKQAEYEELRQAVIKLPDDQQQVIYLRYVEEMGHAEIGRIMAKSEVTVRGILFRAHEALRKQLKRETSFG